MTFGLRLTILSTFAERAAQGASWKTSEVEYVTHITVLQCSVFIGKIGKSPAEHCKEGSGMG